jgi:hypothetical protein
MKMASWRYDAGARRALQSVNMRPPCDFAVCVVGEALPERWMAGIIFPNALRTSRENKRFQ